MKYIICSRIYLKDEMRQESILGSKKTSTDTSQPPSSTLKRNTVGSKASKTTNISKKYFNSRHLRKKAPVRIRPTENNDLSRTKSITSSLSSKTRQKQSEPGPEFDVPIPNSILTAKQSIKKTKQGRHQSTILTNSLIGLSTEGLSKNKDDNDNSQREHDLDPKFKSYYGPDEMRCLALVAHTHMRPYMKTFALTNKNLLSKFKLTGTSATMAIIREVFGDDPDIKYGPTCTSGPLGGNAELVAVMCMENLGACVFFQDPMSVHPHVSDIGCLTRQANVHNIIMMPNPSSAFVAMTTFRIALKEGRAELIPSFFETLVSPGVIEYKKEQNRFLESNVEDLNDYS